MKSLIFIILLLALISCDSQKTTFETQSHFESHISNPDNGYLNSDESDDFVFETKLILPLSNSKSE